MRIILASQSPRRRELLERMGIRDFEVLPARGEELADPSLPPAELVEELSRRKCAEVAALRPGGLVIGADTVVSIDGQVLGKPRDRAEAERMLRALSGRQHTVYTGVTVLYNGTEETGSERTSVRFRPLTDGDITRYIATGEPMDKAGAYGIQGYGSVLVEGISGDYYNVMGLPVCRLGRMLLRFGVDPLALAAEKEQAK
ncbi:MAG: septum formation inhibitor Maf [Lawsonibacter sp.]|nr:septum formation inhibitor Maf [Lawsonibacter sp.]MCI9654978.1 septum formation inhibitor Maf [Lawsonibacter sp.]